MAQYTAGQVLKHVSIPTLTITLISTTSNGWKVTEKDPKSKGKKEKTAYYYLYQLDECLTT